MAAQVKRVPHLIEGTLPIPPLLQLRLNVPILCLILLSRIKEPNDHCLDDCCLLLATLCCSSSPSYLSRCYSWVVRSELRQLQLVRRRVLW